MDLFFDIAVDRARVWALIERIQPLLVTGSPPCTYFSMLNELHKHLHRGDPAWPQRFDDNLEKAKDTFGVVATSINIRFAKGDISFTSMRGLRACAEWNA